jgi:predicted aspartyl protease
VELRLERRLPFVHVAVEHNGGRLVLADVLVDTGSAGTVLRASLLANLGIRREPGEPTYTIRGVGGTEEVILRKIDLLTVGEMNVESLETEIAAMDYGFPIDGILGMDFLTSVGGVIDLGAMQLRAGA